MVERPFLDLHLPALQGPYLAGYTAVQSAPLSYGLQRLDHAVGNVHDMHETLEYLQRATGFHQFAEFTAEVSHVRQHKGTDV